jgi:ABC-type cobalamin/Fe3+-siderophores transport system ATPase subunit
MTVNTSKRSTKKPSAEAADGHLVIKNIGTIGHFAAEFPESGLVEILGPNGCGKTTAIAVVQSLFGVKTLKLTAKDRTLRGEAEGFGKRLTVSTAVRDSGEATCGYIDEDNLIGIAVTGDNMKDPALADARRIKAIIQLAKIESDPSIYYDLVGGQEEFERLIDLNGEATLDPVQLGDKLKRRLEEQARDLEGQAERKRGEEKGHRDAAGDLDMTAEHDSDELQAALEAAVANEQRVKSQMAAYESAVEGATNAKADLDRLISEYSGKNIETARLEESQFQTLVEDARVQCVDLEKLLADAREHYKKCTASLSESIVVRKAAEQHQRSVDTLRRTIANSLPEQPTPEQLTLAQQQVRAARDASEQGVRIRDAKTELVKAERAKEAATDLAEEAERIRNQAKQTGEMLNGLLAKTGAPIRVDGGRLVTDTAKRGETNFHDLSDGERIKLIVDIAFATAGDAKIIALDQRFFEGLDPDNRAMIDREARARGILALGARATLGELRAERFALASAS